MKKILVTLMSVILMVICHFSIFAVERANIIVAKDGSGNFSTIQAAINSIPSGNTSYKIILIKNGVYNEHIFIDKSYLALIGESRENTRIEFSLAREDWNAQNGTNSGSGIIDIGVSSANGTSSATATNVIFGNLTVVNTYPANNDKYTHVVRGEGGCNKIIALYCNFLCTGKDTYALWNKAGVYYQSNCTFKGGIDAVCPRGASYDVECEYFQTSSSAPVWQEGATGANQKYVIRNGVFKPFTTIKFKLLNSQLEPHFYFMDCSLSSSCTAQGSVTSGAAYYYNTHTEGGDQSWHVNNLSASPGNPNQLSVTAAFAYNNTWDPENTMPAALPYASIPQPWNKAYGVSPAAVLKWTGGRNAVSYNVYLGTSAQPSLVTNTTNQSYAPGNLVNGTYYWKVDIVTDQGIIPGTVWTFAVSGSSGTTYTLATSVSGQGSISPASGTFASGTIVALTATPASGWKFDGWSGALSGTANPSNVTMNANKSVTANFSQVTGTTYTLSTSIAGQGSISPASGTYTSGTIVTLTASPASGWKFDGWGGALSGTTNPSNLTMNADESVTATFSQVTTQQTITIQESQTGFCSFNGTIDSDNAGYTGAGFINTPNATGQGITWSVNVPATGTYSLVWRYANSTTTNRTAQVMINGTVAVSSLSFPGTGSWTTWALTPATNVTLTEGTRLIRLQATNSAGLANIDNISITGANPVAMSCTGQSRTAFEADLSEVNIQTGFNLYPNPTSDVVNIRLNNELAKGAIIQLLDNTGKSIIKNKVRGTSHTLDLRGFQSGLYLVSVSNGSKNMVKHVLKK